MRTGSGHWHEHNVLRSDGVDGSDDIFCHGHLQATQVDVVRIDKTNHADNAAKGLLHIVCQLLPSLQTLLLHLFSTIVICSNLQKFVIVD